MAVKLSARQQAQLQFLDQNAPKLARIYALIEKLTTPSEADNACRALARMLDQMKVDSAGLSLSGVSDSAATMAALARRTGGVQTRLRGLRDAVVGLKINWEGARKAASRPAAEDEALEPGH
ncbi:MAG: hypothetical protein AB7I33_17380 [Gemmatimonadales bacterium]